MLKVMLVDDEVFILEGLKKLINWNEEGFEIIATASNGREALEKARENNFDLIIADIQMPEMTGLQLFERIRKEISETVHLVILSGFADFAYAKESIKYQVTDYILKPVDRSALLDLLRSVRAERGETKQREADAEEMRKGYLASNLRAVIRGKFDEINVGHVTEQLNFGSEMRYIEIEPDLQLMEEANMNEEDFRNLQRKLHESCSKFLGEYSDYCVFDVSGEHKTYDVGLILCDDFLKKQEQDEETYLRRLQRKLQEEVGKPVLLLIGKKVQDVRRLTYSYSDTALLRSVYWLLPRRTLYYYENELQVTGDGVLLYKEQLDALINAIEQNEDSAIRKGIENLYAQMNGQKITGSGMRLNFNYLVFQLINLATEQDPKINQEEVMKQIGEGTHGGSVLQGSQEHLYRFASEYASYLAQLRKESSGGLFHEIEMDIRKNYADNLTLKSLSEKYYLNAAYLGQLFRKQYHESFKSYLNRYRMEQALLLLLRSDRKIADIAQDVGYHDADYFVSKFIDYKGCTPAQFRRKARES